MTTMNTPAEIWFTTTKTGKRRAWYWSNLAFRTLPLPLAEAELAIATGASRETEKPMWVAARQRR